MKNKEAIELVKEFNESIRFRDGGKLNEAIDKLLKLAQQNEKQNKLKHYELQREGRLSLCYKTCIDKHDEIEICMWDENFKSRWTIASFDYYEKEKCYELNSCCDRLNNEDINWNNFGILVRAGYKYLFNL